MNHALYIRIHQTLLALITLALLSVPFAHRVGAEPITPEISEYLALGGTLSDICGDTDPHVSGGCESCHIVAAMLLPPPICSGGTRLSFVSVRATTNDAGRPTAPTLYVSPPVRAPPAV